MDISDDNKGAVISGATLPYESVLVDAHRIMAAASHIARKFKRQESCRPDKLHRDVNSIAASLPDKKEWIAEHGLQMLMLNG